MSRATILIVEDEPKLAALLSRYLEADDFMTRWVASGLEVASAVRAQPPDLVLLDLMLPGKDGLAICRELRGFTQVPIVIVTARVEEIDRLLGLEVGADDYICKPFSTREVVARVKAVLRRTSPERARTGPRIDLDVQSMSATLDGHRLDLTAVEFRLLNALAQKAGRIYSRSQLLDLAYSDGRIVLDRTIDTHVKNLRRKLADALPNVEVIHAVYGVGFKLEIPGLDSVSDTAHPEGGVPRRRSSAPGAE
jgi:two-component system response regulator BaeR